MDDKDRKLIRMVGVLSTVGLVMVFATMIGLYLGLKLDAWFGTSPWFTALFLFIGIAAGFRNLFLHAKRSQETFDKKDRDER